MIVINDLKNKILEAGYLETGFIVVLLLLLALSIVFITFEFFKDLKKMKFKEVFTKESIKHFWEVNEDRIIGLIIFALAFTGFMTIVCIVISIIGWITTLLLK